jgi:hypothetical protein
MPARRTPLLQAVRSVPSAPALRQYGTGRVCLRCGAVLSRYNRSGAFCFVHQRRRVVIPERW